MLLPDFEAAHLPAPRHRSSDPTWLHGIAKGKPLFILGGAAGLANSPGLQRARGELVFGTNWTLRTLVPSIWQVVDRNVWNTERHWLAGLDDSLVTLVSQGVFGGGTYSTRGRAFATLIGRRKPWICDFKIKMPRGGQRDSKGIFRNAMDAPFLPKTYQQPFHAGGNSVCYAIQHAHLWGADPVYLLGFTLENGTPYEWGKVNPATKRPAFYEQERALAWLKWYENHFPGRVRLMPGWAGPIYDVFCTEDLGHVKARGSEPGRDQPEADRGDVPAV